MLLGLCDIPFPPVFPGQDARTSCPVIVETKEHILPTQTSIFLFGSNVLLFFFYIFLQFFPSALLKIACWWLGDKEKGCLCKICRNLNANSLSGVGTTWLQFNQSLEHSSPSSLLSQNITSTPETDHKLWKLQHCSVFFFAFLLFFLVCRTTWNPVKRVQPGLTAHAPFPLMPLEFLDLQSLSKVHSRRKTRQKYCDDYICRLLAQGGMYKRFKPSI